MLKLTALFRLTFIVLLAGAGLVLIPACDTEFGAISAWHKGKTAYKIGDYVTALREWQPLAEQGDADAQYMLGLMYSKGQGVPWDDKAAMQWYRRAAEQGYAGAQAELGLMYYHGRGVPKDEKAAVQWYRRAAKQGHADAQFHLGWIYYYGYVEGVPQDKKAAGQWFRRAARQGHAVALRILPNLTE